MIEASKHSIDSERTNAAEISSAQASQHTNWALSEEPSRKNGTAIGHDCDENFARKFGSSGLLCRELQYCNKP